MATNGDKRATPDDERHAIHDVNLVVGTAIRKLRQEKGLSLRELSEASGFSVSFLSLVERGRSSLALTSLQKAAEALGTDVPSLFPSSFAPGRSAPLPHVQRASDEGELTIENSQRTYRLLSGRAPGRILEPILETVSPTSEIEEPYGHEGEEFVYVLEGELVCIVAGVEYELGPGDSIHYKAELPHTLINRTDKPARTIFVVTPRFF